MKLAETYQNLIFKAFSFLEYGAAEAISHVSTRHFRLILFWIFPPISMSTMMRRTAESVAAQDRPETRHCSSGDWKQWRPAVEILNSHGFRQGKTEYRLHVCVEGWWFDGLRVFGRGTEVAGQYEKLQKFGLVISALANLQTLLFFILLSCSFDRETGTQYRLDRLFFKTA